MNTSDSTSASEAAFVDDVKETVAPPLNQVAAATPNRPAGNREPGTGKPPFDLHQEAFEFDPHWQGNPLEAFTFTRQSLAGMLNSQSPGLGDGLAVNEAFMAPIWAVLYLCTHPKEDFRHLRGTPAVFWETIEDWAEAGGCPRDQWQEASDLVWGTRPTEEDQTIPRRLGLWEAARTNVVAVRHRPGAGRLGNAACQ